jgi:dTMP kinase
MSIKGSNPLTIALVGCDGCGKSTHAGKLAELFSRRQMRVTVNDKWHVLEADGFPECRFIRPDLATLRRCISEMAGVGRTLFLFWLISLTAEKTLRAGEADVIIHDGYWAKHACAEIEYGASCELVGVLASVLPVPDITILLDAPPEVTLKRKERGNSLTGYECGRVASTSADLFVRHQSRVRERMLAMASGFGWHTVDASRSEDSVWNLIREVVEGSLLPAFGSDA